MAELATRQREILILLARGLNEREAAAECGITYQTVRHHLQAIRLKLSARNTTHAVVLALTQNLILLEDGHEAEEVVEGHVVGYRDALAPHRAADERGAGAANRAAADPDVD